MLLENGGKCPSKSRIHNEKEDIMKQVIIITAITLGLAAISTATEQADTAQRTAPSERYDKNGDGVLSQEEWPYGADQFTKLDTNGDGVISANEKAGLRGQTGQGGLGRGAGYTGTDSQSRNKGTAEKSKTGHDKGTTGKGGAGRNKS
jgi:hypothetical protein